MYSTQSLIVAGRRRGHFVRVVDHIYCDLIIENKLNEVYYNNIPLRNFDAIIPRIGSTATDYGAAVIRQFEAQNVYTTLTSKALLNARNKLACLQLLSSHGINVPKTLLTNNMLLLPHLLDKLGNNDPLVIKLINSTQGLGVILSESKRNAETTIQALQKLKEKFVVQRFIKESNGSDIRIFIVEGEVVASMKRQAKPGEFRSNLHRGATSMKVTPTREEVKIALKSTDVLGLHVAGVDILRSNQGPLVLEVNASPGLEGIESTTGVDIATRIIELVEQNVVNQKYA